MALQHPLCPILVVLTLIDDDNHVLSLQGYGDSGHIHFLLARRLGGVRPIVNKQSPHPMRCPRPRSFWTMLIITTAQIWSGYQMEPVPKTNFWVGFLEQWDHGWIGILLFKETSWDWEPSPFPWWVIIFAGYILEWTLASSWAGNYFFGVPLSERGFSLEWVHGGCRSSFLCVCTVTISPMEYLTCSLLNILRVLTDFGLPLGCLLVSIIWFRSVVWFWFQLQIKVDLSSLFARSHFRVLSWHKPWWEGRKSIKKTKSLTMPWRKCVFFILFSSLPAFFASISPLHLICFGSASQLSLQADSTVNLLRLLTQQTQGGAS